MVVRFLVTLLFLGLLLFLNRCYRPALMATAGVSSSPRPPALGQLAIEVQPAGVHVAVDGHSRGRTPLTLDLEPGIHSVVVTGTGYIPFSESVEVRAGKVASVRGALSPATGPITGPMTDRALPMPTALPPGAAASPGALATPTPSPAAALSSPPVLTPTPTARPVRVSEGSVELQTYPWADFLTPVWSENYGLEVQALDRPAYEGSGPQLQGVTYRTLTVENDVLRLVFLPELGGRLYRLVFKTTGYDELYQNPVLKPSPWGPLEQGGWLAAGGMEWCLPVEEHGYLWGVPWDTEVIQSGPEATVRLTAPAGQRLRAEVAVTLREGMVEVRPRLENDSDTPFDLKFWTNAMLAPGAANRAGPELRFVLPGDTSQVMVHSRGDAELPAPGQWMSWPVFGGRDLSRLGNWHRWLGFFAPALPAGFVGVYDEAADEGMVRVFPPEVARGVKGFGLGWVAPIDPAQYTDDGSAYVELHGGLALTFDDVYRLAPGEVVAWSEWWYPVAGLGRLRAANRIAALNLDVADGSAQLRLAAPSDRTGQVTLLLNQETLWTETAALRAGETWQRDVVLPADRPARGSLTVQVRSPVGDLWLAYTSEFALR